MSHNKKLTEEQRKEICRLYEEDKVSAYKLAKIFNISEQGVLKNLHNAGVKVRSKPVSLIKTEEDKKSVVNLYLSKTKLIDIRDKYCCSVNTIKKILKEYGIDYEVNTR